MVLHSINLITVEQQFYAYVSENVNTVSLFLVSLSSDILLTFGSGAFFFATPIMAFSVLINYEILNLYMNK